MSAMKRLRQYRQLDFHDVMEFDVSGRIEDIGCDVNQDEMAAPGNVRPIFSKTEFTK